VAALKDHRKRQLEERMRLAGLWQDQGLVFASETGSLLNPSNLRNRSFKRIKARAGVREDLRFHDLRHTCATLLLSRNVNPQIVPEMLGHSSISTTLDTHSHVLPTMQENAVRALEDALKLHARCCAKAPDTPRGLLLSITFFLQIGRFSEWTIVDSNH
jgi:integrase